MTLLVDLNPAEEARLDAAAKQAGLAPAEIVKRLLEQHLPVLSEIDALDAKLSQWQQEDGTVLSPEVSAQALFAQWAEEDARMTQAEREAEDRLWEDLEGELLHNAPQLQLRRLV